MFTICELTSERMEKKKTYDETINNKNIHTLSACVSFFYVQLEFLPMNTNHSFPPTHSSGPPPVVSTTVRV